jgi:hypothetical protein
LKDVSEDQKRSFEIDLFMRSLKNTKIDCLKDLDKIIVPIVEGPEEDEYSHVSIKENEMDLTDLMNENSVA